jgi:hypothetical protein
MTIVPVNHMDQVLEVALHPVAEKSHRSKKNSAKADTADETVADTSE